jgi:flagellar hook-length control protein FliK
VSRIAEKVEQMKDAYPARTVVMTLDPPELGSLELTVRARGHRVEASIVTETDWVRHAIQVHRPQLVDQLYGRGLSLESFDVSSQAQAQTGRGQAEGQPDAAPQARDAAPAPGGEAATPDVAHTVSLSLNSRMFDLRA